MAGDPRGLTPSTVRERLWPPPLWWLVGIGFALSFVVAVAAVLPWEVSLAALIVAMVLVLGVLFGTAPAVGVVDGHVVAGRARLPLRLTGHVTVLRGDALRSRLREQADPKAFLVYRDFCEAAVEIEVTDPADPHPYWLVSSRHADAFAAAVESGRALAVKGA